MSVTIPSGLSRAEAARRLAAEGPNALPSAGRRGVLAIALEVLLEPMFLLLGASVLATIALAYWWAAGTGITAAEIRSFGFAAIVFGNLAMIHSTRSRERIALRAIEQSNPALWWVTLGAVAALAAAIYIPPIAEVFRFAPVSVGYMAVAAVAGALGVFWYEAYKVLRPRSAPV